MQETLVSFRVAELAKEKGFNVLCNYYYETSRQLICFGGSKQSYTSIDKTLWSNMYLLAPTQDLLRKWLLEIHNIHITIFSKSQESWMYRITTKGQSLEEGLYVEDFYSHDEARDEALFQALNLLPDKN